MSGDFLNEWQWSPNGYFDSIDEQALAGTEARAPFWRSAAYANMAATEGLDVGDEVFGGDSYAWVTDGQDEVRQGMRARFMFSTSQVTEDSPSPSNGPGISELVGALYQGFANLWRSMAANYNTDWSQS